MGPMGGEGGGEVVAVGTPKDIAKNKNSLTGRYLKNVR
jgi:excinuclease ABC subunit A